MNSNSRSFGLDLMRTIAIMCVIVAHFIKKLEFAGFWGVELFFGLSGYLIGQILWRSFSSTEDWQFKYLFNFWTRRWWRTLPNYYLFLVLNICYYLVYNKNLLPTPLALSSFFWFGQTISGHQGGFFGESWSLCVEEWFYLLFPLLVFALKKTTLNHKRSFILSLLIFFIGCALVRYYLISKGLGTSVRGFTFARLDAISYGVCIAFIFSTQRVSNLKRTASFIIGILGLAISIVTITIFHLTYNQVRGNLLLLAAVPLSFALTLPLISVIKSPKGIISAWIEKISLWSYSLYLCHMILLLTAYKCVSYIKYTDYNTSLAKLLTVIVAIFVSSLLFKYFELPFTRKRPSELKG